MKYKNLNVFKKENSDISTNFSFPPNQDMTLVFDIELGDFIKVNGKFYEFVQPEPETDDKVIFGCCEYCNKNEKD